MSASSLVHFIFLIALFSLNQPNLITESLSGLAGVFAGGDAIADFLIGHDERDAVGDESQESVFAVLDGHRRGVRSRRNAVSFEIHVA